jgi:hypothetical protein
MLIHAHHPFSAAARLFDLGLPLCLVPIVLAASSFAPPRTSDCVAWWRFQNGVKDTAAGPGQLIEDSSGNDQHGLAFGGPCFRRVALPGSNLALQFHGDGQRVVVPDDEVFQLTHSLTLEAYVEVDGYPDYASQILFRGDDRGGFDPWFLKLTESGRLQFTVTDDSNESSAVTSPAPLPLHTWLHVAGTLDDTTGEQRLFVNGACVATVNTSIRPFAVLGGAEPGISIGNLQSTGNQGFLGSIDEVRISSSALTPDRLLPPPKPRLAERPAEMPAARRPDR